MNHNIKNIFFMYRLPVIQGLVLGVLYWIFDAVTDTIFLDMGNLFERLLAPGSQEIWMRSLIIAFLTILLSVHTRMMANQKRAEEKIKEQNKLLINVNKSLRESEEKFSKAFQTSSVLKAISTLEEGYFIEVNDEFLRSLGYKREEVIGRTSGELGLFADISQRDAAVKIIKEEGRAQNLEVDVRAKNGDIRHGLFSADTVQLQDERCLLTVMNDITERKRAEKELAVHTGKLEQANKKLRQQQRELEEFIYTVSHDLKAPLISIQGFTEMIKKDASENLDIKSNEYLERISSNTLNMETMLSDLLKLSGIGRVDDVSQRINTDDLVNNILENFSAVSTGKNIKIIHKKPIPDIFGSQKRIRAVFENLIDNAVKYMPEKENATVEIGFDSGVDDSSGNKGAYFVRDNGDGIPGEFQSKAFNIFQRGYPASEKTEGAGMGLSIAKRIMETHGGNIWLKSAGGEGTTFYFTFPPDKTYERDSHPSVEPARKQSKGRELVSTP